MSSNRSNMPRKESDTEESEKTTLQALVVHPSFLGWKITSPKPRRIALLPKEAMSYYSEDTIRQPLGCISPKTSRLFSRSEPFQILPAARLNSGGLCLPGASSCLPLHCQNLQRAVQQTRPLFPLAGYRTLLWWLHKPPILDESLQKLLFRETPLQESAEPLLRQSAFYPKQRPHLQGNSSMIREWGMTLRGEHMCLGLITLPVQVRLWGTSDYQRFRLWGHRACRFHGQKKQKPTKY